MSTGNNWTCKYNIFDERDYRTFQCKACFFAGMTDRNSSWLDRFDLRSIVKTWRHVAHQRACIHRNKYDTQFDCVYPVAFLTYASYLCLHQTPQLLPIITYRFLFLRNQKIWKIYWGRCCFINIDLSVLCHWFCLIRTKNVSWGPRQIANFNDLLHVHIICCMICWHI